jgi:hypothetical protein
MDKMRAQLEDLRELRDLVRSLGRGGGWGPLRRAPVQYLDMKGRPGLLRTILEQQETRGLTRSDDISRLLPSEVPIVRALTSEMARVAQDFLKQQKTRGSTKVVDVFCVLFCLWFHFR